MKFDKPGEVICVVKAPGFTLYKTYTAYRAVSSNLLKIIDDDDFVDTICDDFFMSIQDYRNSKIDEILG